MISGTFWNGEGRKFPAPISERIWHVLGHRVREYALKECLVKMPIAIAGSYKLRSFPFGSWKKIGIRLSDILANDSVPTSSIASMIKRQYGSLTTFCWSGFLHAPLGSLHILELGGITTRGL